ncbi:hypothetical protein [Anaeromicropila populeti]|uniref:Uncharacterized protein n=1 Tax=Anaeromicropila populeti TaxID=37658 RepID=A0A1I6JM78_9FIRM|nr:hypothetical protein [Anaeromicropila populeti]SFR80047.1 hypothetical protein SAMN05661086_01752 [Anaeromicropila populeti]
MCNQINPNQNCRRNCCPLRNCCRPAPFVNDSNVVPGNDNTFNGGRRTDIETNFIGNDDNTIIRNDNNTINRTDTDINTRIRNDNDDNTIIHNNNDDNNNNNNVSFGPLSPITEISVNDINIIFVPVHADIDTSRAYSLGLLSSAASGDSHSKAEIERSAAIVDDIATAHGGSIAGNIDLEINRKRRRPPIPMIPGGGGAPGQQPPEPVAAQEAENQQLTEQDAAFATAIEDFVAKHIESAKQASLNLVKVDKEVLTQILNKVLVTKD